MKDVLYTYDNCLVDARTALAKQITPWVSHPNPQRLQLFLLYFVARQLRFAQEVAGLHRDAGNRSQRLGFPYAAKFLLSRVQFDWERQQLLANDLQNLLDLINHDMKKQVSKRRLMRMVLTQVAREFQGLYRGVGKSKEPYQQLAMDYEIHRGLVIHGSVLIQLCQQELPFDIMKMLKSARAEANGAKQLNQIYRQALAEFLQRNPKTLPTLVKAGVAGVQHYQRFLQDCYMQTEMDTRLQLSTVE